MDRTFFSLIEESLTTIVDLAAERLQAITSAQDWSADVSYTSRQLVKQDGRYWVAIASSYGSIPAELDSPNWFDLGPIDPVAIDGYYPLYWTAEEADAASSSNSHHTHVLNEITYYMPNGGTIYHGNYSG